MTDIGGVNSTSELTLRQLCIISLFNNAGELFPTNYSDFIKIIESYDIPKSEIKTAIMTQLKSRLCRSCFIKHKRIYQIHEEYPSVMHFTEVISRYPKNNLELMWCLSGIKSCEICN